ncbi:MAG: hypothetical protein ACYDA1_10305 [Vulcanimicrobiaceae bacterium]
MESHFERRRRLADGKAWIPPVPLAFGLLAQGVGWAAFGMLGDASLSPWMLVWIHAMVLGWLTATSLAFLVHVLPTFTDVKLRYERLARTSLWSYLAGVVLLLVGFAESQTLLLVYGGWIITFSVILFSISALKTVADAMQSDEPSVRAVARALGVTIVVLVATVVVGTLVAEMLQHGWLTSLRIVRVHAVLGLVGWLAVLVVGVSARTFNRLVGRSRSRKHVHIIVGMCAWLGLALILLANVTTVHIVTIFGVAVLVAGAGIYGVDNLLALRSSGGAVFPRLFIAASQLWLFVTGAFGVLALFGWQHAFFAMLVTGIIGWIGQTVYAHIAHVGVRLIATLVLGADDTTSPKALIDARVATLFFVVAQATVISAVVAVLTSHALAYRIASDVGMLNVVLAVFFVLSAAENARRITVRGSL